MKILIDDCLSTLGDPGGIGYQSLFLARHLKRFVACDFVDHRYLRFVPRVVRKFSYVGLANLEALRDTYDLVHYQTHYVPILKGKSKRVVTIYDLGAYRFPETIPTIWRRYNQHAIANSVLRADAIITASIFIKEEILSLFDYRCAEDIYVCPAGIREVFFTQKAEEDRIRRWNLEPYTYFFFLGDLTRRKNLEFLLQSFRRAKAHSLLSPGTRLALAGKPYWGYRQIQKFIREEEDILSLGYVDDEDICSLYRFSLAFVYPSIYEGFGMPILEAMSQRTPIIVSNIPTSLELNKVHNSQMTVFALEDEGSLTTELVNTEKNASSIRKSLDYGDISMYRYEQIAMQHLDVYRQVLRR